MAKRHIENEFYATRERLSPTPTSDTETRLRIQIDELLQQNFDLKKYLSDEQTSVANRVEERNHFQKELIRLNLKNKEEVRDLKKTIDDKDSLIQSLQQNEIVLEGIIEKTSAAVATPLQSEIKRLNDLLTMSQNTLSDTIQAKDVLIKDLNEQIERLQRVIEALSKEKEANETQAQKDIADRDASITGFQRALEALNQEKETNEKQALQGIADRNAYITNLQRDIEALKQVKEANEQQAIKEITDRDTYITKLTESNQQIEPLLRALEALSQVKESNEKAIQTLTDQIETIKIRTEDALTKIYKDHEDEKKKLQDEKEELQSELEELQDENENLQDELKKAREAIPNENARLQADFETARQALQTKFETASQAFPAMQADNARLQAEIETARQALAAMQAELETARQKLQECASLQAENARLQAEIETARQALASVETEIQNVRQKLQECASLQADNARMRAENETARQKLASLETELEIAKGIIGSNQTQNETDLAAAQAKIKNINTELAAAQAKIENINTELEDARETIEKLETELEDALGTIKDMQAKIEDKDVLIESIKQLKAEMLLLTNAQQQKQTEIDSARAEVETARAQWNAMQSTKTQEVQGLIQKLQSARETIARMRQERSLQTDAVKTIDRDTAQVTASFIAARDELAYQTAAIAREKSALQTKIEELIPQALASTRYQSLLETQNAALQQAESSIASQQEQLHRYKETVTDLKSELSHLRSVATDGGVTLHDLPIRPDQFYGVLYSFLSKDAAAWAANSVQAVIDRVNADPAIRNDAVLHAKQTKLAAKAFFEQKDKALQAVQSAFAFVAQNITNTKALQREIKLPSLFIVASVATLLRGVTGWDDLRAYVNERLGWE